MKNIVKRIVAAGVGLGLLASPVMAAPLNNDDATVFQQGILAGALTLQAPADVTLADITVSSEQQAVEGEMADWKVDDARGHKPAAIPGWSLTMTASDLTDTHLAPEEVSNIDVTNLTVTPNDAQAFFSADVADMSLGGATALLDTGDDGTSDAATIATAAALYGRGRFQGDVEMDWIIPANSDATTYRSTMTYTLL